MLPRLGIGKTEVNYLRLAFEVRLGYTRGRFSRVRSPADRGFEGRPEADSAADSEGPLPARATTRSESNSTHHFESPDKCAAC